MTDKRLIDAWAWSQVEAAADGSLDGEAVNRMADAVADDPRLRAAVARARAVRSAIRSSAAVPMPAGLLATLLAIPRGSPRHDAAARIAGHRPWAPLGAVAAAGLAAIVVADLAGTHMESKRQAQLGAVQDFEIAIGYLRQSTAVTSREVGAALNGGVAAALDVSRESLTRRTEPGG